MIYQFGNFTLDAARRELRRGEAVVAVEPQVFDVLKFLIGARDRVVSRDDLLEAVWHGRIVSEATLSSRLNAARSAIGDTGAEQRLIRTFQRKGVRFVGVVQEIEDEAAVAGPSVDRRPGRRGSDHAPDPSRRDQVFTDVSSGRSMDRPSLAELLASARRGDTLAIVRLSIAWDVR